MCIKGDGQEVSLEPSGYLDMRSLKCIWHPSTGKITPSGQVDNRLWTAAVSSLLTRNVPGAEVLGDPHQAVIRRDLRARYGT